MKAVRSLSVFTLVLLVVGMCVAPTNAKFTDSAKVTASISTTKYVPEEAKAVQYSNDSSGKSRVFVSWNALSDFTSYRVEWSSSATGTAAGNVVVTGTETTITGLANGTWFIKISPSALSVSGRSQYAKVIVGLGSLTSVTRITPQCSSLSGENFDLSCENRTVEVLDGVVYSAGYSNNYVVSLPVGASANTAPTKLATPSAPWVKSDPYQPYGATQMTTNGDNIFYTINTNGVDVSQDGVYRYNVSTKGVANIFKYERVYSLAIDPSSSARRYWITHANANGTATRTLSYCSTGLVCTTVRNFPEWISNISLSGGKIWLVGLRNAYRVDASTLEYDLVARFPETATSSSSWENRTIYALSATNAVIVGSEYSERIAWNVSISDAGVRSTRVIANFVGSAMNGSSGAKTDIRALSRSGTSWFVAVSGSENKTADGIWRFTASVATTPL